MNHVLKALLSLIRDHTYSYITVYIPEPGYKRSGRFYFILYICQIGACQKMITEKSVPLRIITWFCIRIVSLYSGHTHCLC